MNILDQLDLSPDKLIPKETHPKKDDLMSFVFEYLNSITVTKKDIMLSDTDIKKYQQGRFLILRALSFYKELIPIVNLINVRSMSPRMEYDMLLHVVPRKVRRDRWPKKPPKSLFLRSIQEYYGFNEKKAEQAMKILTIEQMTAIDNKSKKEDAWTFSRGSGSKSR